jgi:hypothetical protein
MIIINNIYQIIIAGDKYFVNEGYYNDIPTKWITKTKWNGKMRTWIYRNKIKYTDIDENEIFIFNINDKQYDLY